MGAEVELPEEKYAMRLRTFRSRVVAVFKVHWVRAVSIE